MAVFLAAKYKQRVFRVNWPITLHVPVSAHALDVPPRPGWLSLRLLL